MTPKKPDTAIQIDVEKELHEATLRIMEYESQIQSGEADAYDEITLAKRRLLREQAKRNLRLRGDVQTAVARVDVRRMLFRILEIAGPNRLSPNISDPYMTAQADGKREVANGILLMLYDADPNVYAQMQREHLSDIKSDLERKNREMESAPQ